MSADLLLNVILTTAVLLSLIRAAHQKDKPRPTLSGGTVVIVAVLGLTQVTCFIWLSSLLGYWQFAAISTVPVLITLGASLARDENR